MAQKPLSSQVYENKRYKSGSKKWRRNSGYGRIPFAVLSDHRIELVDLRVYSVLSWAERGGRAYIGERLIGEICEIGREDVRDSILRLVDRRHVRVRRPQRRGERNCYILTHPMFTVSPKAVGSEGRKESEGLFCGGCQKPMRGAVCEDCMRIMELANAI